MSAGPRPQVSSHRVTQELQFVQLQTDKTVRILSPTALAAQLKMSTLLHDFINCFFFYPFKVINHGLQLYEQINHRL